MIAGLKRIYAEFPRQFWIVVLGIISFSSFIGGIIGGGGEPRFKAV